MVVDGAGSCPPKFPIPERAQRELDAAQVVVEAESFEPGAAVLDKIEEAVVMEFKNEIGAFGADAPDTSREAAIEVYFDTASDKHLVLTAIADACRRGGNGLTSDEAEEAFGYPHQTMSARFNDLKNLVMIQPNGEKRPTRAGMARVAQGKNATKAEAYEPTEKGWQFLRTHGDYRGQVEMGDTGC